MAYRICSYCFVGYSDEEGPHPYTDCLARIETALDSVAGQLGRLTEARREIRTKIAAGSPGRKVRKS